MTLRRRVLFYTFTLLFFVGGGVLLFVAQGYRYSPAKGSVELTGEIAIDSQPHGAHVEIDGRMPVSLLDRLKGKQEVTTPARIGSLLSGVYRLVLKKDGYYPWFQTVTVFAGRAVVFGEVHLLPLPKKTSYIDSPAIVELITLPGTRLLYRTSDHSVGILDTRSKEFKTLFTAREDIRSVSLSPSQKKLLIQGASRIWILDIDTARAVGPMPTGAKKKFAWSLRDDLYALTTTGVAIFVRRTSAFSEIIRGSFTDMSIGDRLITIDSGRAGRAYSVRTYTSLPGERSSKHVDRIVLHQGETIAFADSLKGEIALFPKGSLAREPIRIPHAHSLFMIDQSRFIVWDDYEVTLLSISDGRVSLKLVTRQSTPIREVYVAKGIPYVFIVNRDGSVNVQETGGESQNHYQIFTSDDGIQSFSEVNSVLYFTGQFKEGIGIIPLPLRE